MIARILKSKMAPIIPRIIEPILASADTKLGVEMEGDDEKGAEFDLDSDEDEEQVVGLDLEGVDE